MRKIRNSAVALLTAGALVLTAAPAMAQSSTGSSASSEIGKALDATENERNIFGSSKNFDDVSTFGQVWYGYTLAATAVAAAGLYYANISTIENTAAAWGIQLDLPGN